MENCVSSSLCKRHRFVLSVGKIPWSRKWQPTPVFLTEKFCEQRNLSGYSLWGHNELNTTEYLHTHTNTHTHTHTHTCPRDLWKLNRTVVWTLRFPLCREAVGILMGSLMAQEQLS